MSGRGERPELADLRSIGQRVAGYRRRRRLSLQGLALRLYRSVEWVHKVERGERRIDSIRVVLELADALGVPAGNLLGAPLARRLGERAEALAVATAAEALAAAPQPAAVRPAGAAW